MLGTDRDAPLTDSLSLKTRFIIKMPLLHRLACFRDDVVFLILREFPKTLHSSEKPPRTHTKFSPSVFTVYQMWIYKVDPTRENEYGELFRQGFCSFVPRVGRPSLIRIARVSAGQKLSKEEAEKLLQQQKADKANNPTKEAGKAEKKEPIKETKKNK